MMPAWGMFRHGDYAPCPAPHGQAKRKSVGCLLKSARSKAGCRHELHSGCCRAEQKGGQQQYQPVTVNVSLDEIDAGLKLHRTAPELLKKGLVMEAARGAYAQEG